MKKLLLISILTFCLILIIHDYIMLFLGETFTWLGFILFVGLTGISYYIINYLKVK